MIFCEESLIVIDINPRNTSVKLYDLVATENQNASKFQEVSFDYEDFLLISCSSFVLGEFLKH